MIYQESSFTASRKFAERYRGKIFDAEKRTEHMAKQFYNEILSL